MKKLPRKILIVDDDNNLRCILRDLMGGFGFIPMEAADGFDAISIFEKDRPNAVLLDLQMPGIDGFETMRRLRQINARVPVIILTGYGDVPTAVKATKAGAYDFITKPPDMDRLIDIIGKAVSGRRPGVGKKDPVAATVHEILTGREHEVLFYIGEGLTSRQIAERLSISPRTVDTHRYNIMHKVGARSRAGLIRYALKEGIFSQKE